MNAADVIVIILLAAVLVRAFVVIHNDRKKGKGCLGCSGNCSNCSLHCMKEQKS